MSSGMRILVFKYHVSYYQRVLGQKEHYGHLFMVFEGVKITPIYIKKLIKVMLLA